MSRKNIIIVIIAIFLTILILITTKDRKEVTVNNIANKSKNSIIYNKIIDEETGKEKYVIYDKNTGEERVRVDEYQLKIYETDPDYEELPVENEEKMINEYMGDY